MAKKKRLVDPNDPRLVAWREWRYAVDRVASVEEQIEQLEEALKRDEADRDLARNKLADALSDCCLVVNGIAYASFLGHVVEKPAIVISEAKQ